MKTVSTIAGWKGVEPPDIRPLRRQARRLWHAILIEHIDRRFQVPGWFGYGIFTLCTMGLLANSGTLLRRVDPTAAVIDIGALSLVLLAVVALANFLAVSRWLIGLLFPVLRAYQKNHFSNNFKSLSPWQKITFYLVIFFGLLYAFVVCLVAVF